MKKFIFIMLVSFISLSASDIDNDLVKDNLDMCPNTPAGVFVDMQGCTKILERVVNFDHNSYHLDINNTKRLYEIIELANEVFGYNIVLKAHTDSTADYKTNLIISKYRAYTVLKIFKKAGIDISRISIKWYGEMDPIATNVTKEGRAKNRRVDIILR